MVDREKVIRGLEEVSDFFYDMYRKEQDSYKYTKAKEYCDIAEDALALLKEQQKLIDDITQRRANNGAFD